MEEEFRRDYLVRLPLPLAQLYDRAYNEGDVRSQHENAFYLCEALIKLMAAPLIAAYLHEVRQGAQRRPSLDQRLLQLTRPALGEWLGMLRELARYMGERPQADRHPLGHLWPQLTQRHRDKPGLLALYQDIKNGPDGQRAGEQSCTVLQVLEALVTYRNEVFGHGAGRPASFFGRMRLLLLPAVNDMLAADTLSPLGPPGTRLVYVTELRVHTAHTMEIGLRDLVGPRRGEVAAPLHVRRAEAEDLLPERVAVLWPGHPLPLRLDPLLVYHDAEDSGAEVWFLNQGRQGRQVEYLSYATGQPVRHDSMAPELLDLLSLVKGQALTEAELATLAAQREADAARQEAPATPSVPASTQPPTPGSFSFPALPGSAGVPPAPQAPRMAALPESGNADNRELHGPVPDPLRVVLIYKRSAQPDEEVLLWLEAQLTAQGYQVFIDRHLSIGIEWAQEIERQIRRADAVMPLLSAASIQSEMLAWEVHMARDTAATQHGRPRLLPVRVQYTGRLSEELASALDPIQQFSWAGPQDHPRLLAEVLHALRTPAALALQTPPTRRDWAASPEGLDTPPGGAVPLGSPLYLDRLTDAAFHAALARHDSIVLVKGARQMGKTSLLTRGLHAAQQAGGHVVLTDFQSLNQAQLESIDTFYRALGAMLADQLNLTVFPEHVWQTHFGPNQNFERYLRREVLDKVPGFLLWGLDEVDRLFPCPFHSDVFGLFRSWHNRRASPQGEVWQRLTLAIAYATEAHLFITNLDQSPFNVGTRLSLEDWTLAQVAELNRRYESPLPTATDVVAFVDLLGGQPYLVSRGLYALRQRQLDLPALCAQADRDEGLFGDHLRRILVLLVDPDLRRSVEEVLQGRPCPGQRSFDRLHSAGVLAGHTPREARLRCQLYAAYLRRHLLEER